MLRDIDKKHNVQILVFKERVFRQFLCKFSIFFKTGSSAEIPINSDRIVSIKMSAQRLKYKANNDY